MTPPPRHETVRGTARVITLAGLLLLAACGGSSAGGKGATSAAGATKPPASAVNLVTPARLFVVPDPAEATPFTVEPDGSRMLIVRGMRLIERLDGSLQRGRQLFDANRTVRPLEVPARLGGGYLFLVHHSGSAMLWRSKTWTGKLRAYAHVGFGVGGIVPGFDRLYALESSGRALVALDPESGAITDVGSLPPSPTYGRMGFADSWLGAVEVPYRGVLVTFDAGASWRPLGVESPNELGVVDGRLVIGEAVLDPDGRLRQRASGDRADAAFRGAGRETALGRYLQPGESEPETKPGLSPPGPLGRQPLRSAVLHGFPVTSETAVVAAQGTLARVRLRDGKLLRVKERAYPEGEDCHGVRVGGGFGFVCGSERGRTVVYRFHPPLGLRPVLEFAHPRYVASSGTGALVVRGSCDPDTAPAQSPGTYCIRRRDGQLRSLRITGDRGVERVVALADGRTAVLVPPRRGARGTLTLVAADGTGTKHVRLKLPKRSSKQVRALLKRGLWLDGFVEYPRGQLTGWVAAGGPFVGVRVSLDGQVKTGKLEHDIERTLLTGRAALLLGYSGRARQSTNGGFKWREVELPFEFDSLFEASSAARTEARVRGCSAVGCAFGPWVRVGWLGPDDEDELEIPELPDESMGPAPRGGRWLLKCAPTGKVAGPRRAARAPAPEPEPEDPLGYRPPGSSRTPPLRGTAWLPFLGRAAPRKAAGEIGFDTGTEHLDVYVHGYAWGARGADWERAGRWQIYAEDRFALGDAVWASGTSRSPWPDARAAARAFGHEGPANWAMDLDPGGRAGVLAINNGGTHELYLVEAGRSIVSMRNAGRWEITHLAGAVKVGSTWFVGHASSAGFRVFRLAGDRISLVRYYPALVGGQSSARAVASLVRSQRGDALAIWARDVRLRGSATRWFIYPLDRASGEVSEPLVLDAEQLSEPPRPCTAGDDGWLLEGSPPIDPYVDVVGADQVRVPRRVIARVLVGPHGLCLDSLAAEAESNLPDRVSSTVGQLESGRPTAPMVLAGRGRGARRWELRCGR